MRRTLEPINMMIIISEPINHYINAIERTNSFRDDCYTSSFKFRTYDYKFIDFGIQHPILLLPYNSFGLNDYYFHY